jgi:hypothetical protein
MRLIVASALVALALFSGARMAAADASTATIFACSIGAKKVWVTMAGGRFVYHFGTPAKEEMTIVGVPAAGNVFQMAQRFAGPEYQLRFVNGEFSYIVYSAEGNNAGAASVSGLVVMRGDKRISDSACSHFAELAMPDGALGAPQDKDDYSAM